MHAYLSFSITPQTTHCANILREIRRYVKFAGSFLTDGRERKSEREFGKRMNEEYE